MLRGVNVGDVIDLILERERRHTVEPFLAKVMRSSRVTMLQEATLDLSVSPKLVGD